MKLLKWLCVALATLLLLVAIGGMYAAIWVTGDIAEKVGTTAYLSLFLAMLPGFVAVVLHGEGY